MGVALRSEFVWWVMSFVIYKSVKTPHNCIKLISWNPRLCSRSLTHLLVVLLGAEFCLCLLQQGSSCKYFPVSAELIVRDAALCPPPSGGAGRALLGFGGSFVSHLSLKRSWCDNRRTKPWEVLLNNSKFGVPEMFLAPVNPLSAEAAGAGIKGSSFLLPHSGQVLHSARRRDKLS